MTDQALRVELVIARDDEQRIHGSVREPGLDPVPFAGWLELMSVVERIGHQEPAPEHGGDVG